MRIPKRYGQSRIDNCPFCQKQAVTENVQGVPVCSSHKRDTLQDMKCLCGDWLDVRKGKHGAYFNCIKCGNINFRKGLEMNPDIEKRTGQVKTENKKEEPPEKTRSEIRKDIKEEKEKQKKEIVLRSDEVDFYGY